MAIVLKALEPETRHEVHINGPVAHLGRSCPEGKEGLALIARGVADHHGKIFHGFNSYYYVSLTDRPTELFRGPNFSFHLDQLAPQCPVYDGDQLKMGEALVRIIKLTPPVPAPVAGRRRKRSPLTAGLRCRYVDCRRGCESSRLGEVVHATSGHIYRIRNYAEPHEILRASVDWMLELYEKPVGLGIRPKLTVPEAIAIKPRPDLAPSWPGSHVPIEKAVSKGEAVRAVEQRGIPPERFDAGAAFIYTSDDGKLAGIGAGILEGIYDAEAVPRASHFLLVQYPPDRKPNWLDACVVHHVAAQISQFLGDVRANRLRQLREVERRLVMDRNHVYHEVRGKCSEVRNAIKRVKSALKAGSQVARSDLDSLENVFESLVQWAKKGEWSLSPAGLIYAKADLHSLCAGVLRAVFGDSEELKSLTRWEVRAGPKPDARLAGVPCDRAAIESCVYDLIVNSDGALGKRGKDPRRVCIFLDVIEQDGLPYSRIRVADNGVGMAPEIRSAIFGARFSTKRGGRGLGAMRTADLVARHRGFIEVASAPDEGTVVDILLPMPRSSRGLDMKRPGAWLAPYTEQAALTPLVKRGDLSALLRQDAELGNWYRL